MIETFEIELKNEKISYSQWFIFSLLGLAGVFAGTMANIDTAVQLSIYTISVIALLYGLLLIQKKIFIGIEGKNFFIKTSLLGRIRSKYYKIEFIENLVFLKNVNSGIAVSKGQIKVMGIDVSPGSLKEYYYHKELICFEYMGKKVDIGKWKKPYGGSDMVQKIKEIANKY